MSINHEDREELKEYFDGIYVKKKDCSTHRGAQYEIMNKNALDVAKISTKLNMIVAILGAIGVAICAAVIKIIFGG